MGATPGDGLPWPENGDPAMVPQDMQELATATQAALDKKTASTPVFGAFTADSGWTGTGGYGTPGVLRHGKVCIGQGMLTRTGSDITMNDNATYRIGTLPAGFRPPFTVRVPASWQARNSSGTDQHSPTTAIIDTNGVVSVIASFSGTIKSGTAYLSLAGLSWSAA